MVELDDREGFDDTKQVLFQQHIVQRVKMTLDEVIALQLSLKFFQNFVKALEGSIRVGISDGGHRSNIPSSVLQRKLSRDDGVNVLGGILHDFAQKHVFEALGGILRLLQAVVGLKGLEKVGVRGFVILLFSMQNTRLGVDGALEGRGAIDGVGGGPGSCEGSTGAGDVAESVLDSAFKEMDFNQEGFVVEFLDFVEKGGQQCERSLVILGLKRQISKTALQPLTKEGPLFVFSPFNTVTHKL